MDILKSKTVEAHFLAMLNEANVGVLRPDIRQVWNVFKQFAQLPIECAAERCSESFLLECGCYDFADGEFCFHFSRNFHIVDNGASWTEMLDCDFSFNPNSTLQNLEIYIEKFVSDYANSTQALAAFAQEVEAQTHLWEIISKHQPSQFSAACYG